MGRAREQVTPTRRAFLESNPTAQLTDAEIAAGWRFCAERDGHVAHVDELRDCLECSCLQ